MRTLLAAFAFSLAACGQTAAPQVEAPAPEDAFVDPYAAALTAPPASGAWTLLGDDATVAACFGPPQAASEAQCQLSIICGPTQLTVRVAHALAPDQDTVLRLFNTPDLMLDLPARSSSGSVSADLASTAAERPPLVTLLSPRQERFGVEIAGQITTYAWDESIARTLAGCAT